MAVKDLAPREGKVARVRIHRRTLVLATAAVVVTSLAACGSSSSSGGLIDPTGATTSSAAASPSESTSVPADTNLTAEMVKVTGGIKETPKVTFPFPSSATELTSTDDVVGTGAEVKATDSITFNYVGVGAQSGMTFDSSYERGAPITYPLAQLIPGWQQGIPGMKVGGRRVLVIPGALAYGANPPTPSIAPNETLVFVLDVLAIK